MRNRIRRTLVGGLLLVGLVVVPHEPAGADYFGAVTGAAVSVSGTYIPVVGNFTGDGRDDIFWYAPGSAGEKLWEGYGGGEQPFIKSNAQSVNGTYRPIVGNFSGDAYDEIFWYAPGTAPDSLWDNPTGGSFTARSMSVSGTYTPIVLDTAGSWSTIFWYAPGSATDWSWAFSNTSMTKAPQQIGGNHQPLVGDFGGDGSQDIFWYTAGTATDALWTRSGDATFAKSNQTVNGSYRPAVGQWSATDDGTDDILWLNAAGTDPLFEGTGAGGFSSSTIAIPNRRAIVSDGPGKDLLVLWGGTAPDQVWLRESDGSALLALRGGPKAPEPSVAFTGRFQGTSLGALFFYRAGPAGELYLR